MPLSILFALYIITGCNKIEPYSLAPKIEHSSLHFQTEVINSQQIVGEAPDTIKAANISFQLYDGDGDIGPADSIISKDTTQTGVHLWLLVQKEGTLAPPADSSLRYIYYDLPDAEQYATSGQVKAQIDIGIKTYHSALFFYDSIAYRYYVIDKSGNKSNTEVSEIAVLQDLQ